MSFWSELTKYFKKGPFVLIDNYFTSILSLLLFFKRFTFFLAIVFFFFVCVDSIGDGVFYSSSPFNEISFQTLALDT